MSLDISIMDEHGSPQESVPLTVDEHSSLIELAQRMHLAQWMRMSDYHEDADYAMEELGILVQETVRLEAACSEENLVGKLQEIEALLEAAILGRKEVSAIAD